MKQPNSQALRQGFVRLRMAIGDFSASALMASLLMFVIAFIVFEAVGVGNDAPGSTELQSTENVRFEHALTRNLEAVGGRNCATTRVVITKSSLWVAPVRAVADVRCHAVGSGAQEVGALQFSTPTDLKAWKEMHTGDLLISIGGGGTCEGTPGQSSWADINNRVRGMIFCETNSSHSEIAWSDDAANIAYYALTSQNNLESLFDWWQGHIRHIADTKLAAERRLHHIYAPKVDGGLSNCRTGHSPLAEAVLVCVAVHPTSDPSARADSLTLYDFATTEQLEAFYETYTTQFHAPNKGSGATCGTTSLVATTFGRPTVGREFCFPADTGESPASWLLWTYDRERTAALLERLDQNQEGLHEVWEDLL